MAQESMSIYPNGSEAYQDWLKGNLSDLQEEFLGKATVKVSSEEVSDYLDAHNDLFNEYCESEYNSLNRMV